MKKIKVDFRFRLLFIVLPGLLIFQSCKLDNRICVDLPPDFIEVALVDSNNNLLIGSVYNPDSIKLTLDDKLLDINFDQGYLVINYAGMDIYNLKKYLLYLNYQDSDTLNLSVSGHYDDQCGSYYTFSGLKFNSRNVANVPGDNTRFKIIK